MNNAQKFADFCDTTLSLYDRLIQQGRRDPNETFYKSLPVCIIDAVFSIGVNYTSVEKATCAFFRHFGLVIPREFTGAPEYAIDDFIRDMETFSSFDEAAQLGFRNRQRTSTANGILKAEACYRVAQVFQRHNINTLSDFNNYPDKPSLDADILKVKGQGSGIMLKYLYMLAGKSDEVKPDRHMVNFIRKVFPDLTMATKDHAAITDIMVQSAAILREKYPQLTPRFLDYLIWDYMRSNGA